MTGIVLLLVFILFPQCALAKEDDPIDTALRTVDLSPMEEALERDGADFSALFPAGLREAVRSAVNGEETFFAALWEAVKASANEVFRSGRTFFLTLFSCTMFSGMMGQCTAGMRDPAMKRAVDFAASGAVLIPLLSALLSSVKLAGNTLDRITAWMNVLLPAMLTVLSSVGAAGSANGLQPAGLLIGAIAQQAASGILFPMILFMGALSGVDALSQTPRFRGIVELFRKTAAWGLGVGTSVFTGAMTVRSVTAAASDALGIRTVKMTVGAVPVVGSAVSDSAELLIHCMLMVKNGIGLTGLAAALLIAAAPVLEIAARIWCIRFCAALTEAFSPQGTSAALKETAGLFGSILSVVVAVCFLFFLTVTLGVAAGRSVFWG